MQKDTLQTMSSDNEKDLFREAVKNVKPLKIKSKTVDASSKKPKPKPIAKKSIDDERQVLLDALSDDYIFEDVESEEGLLFLRSSS